MLARLKEARALGTSASPTPHELARLLSKSEEGLGLELDEAARQPIMTATLKGYATGLAAVSADFSLTLPDLDALDVLRAQTSYWVRNAYSKVIRDDVAQALKTFFAEGHTRLELSARLGELLTDKRPTMHGYFDLLSDHTVTRIAEMGHVAGYERAGIEYVEIVAVLDSRTSPICRHLHGRMIPVSSLSAQRESILRAARRPDTDATKRAHPMLRSDSTVLLESKTSKIIEQGIGMPPYHFRCRSTTVAHFEPADYWERASHWAIDGEIPKRELTGLMDYARNSHWGTHRTIWDRRHGGDGEQHATSFVHYQRHGRQRYASMEAYNQAAVDLIRRGGRQVFLTIKDKEHPYPVLLFRDPKTAELAVVNLKGQNLASFYLCKGRKWQKRLNENDIAIELPRGLQKWTRFGHL